MTPETKHRTFVVTKWKTRERTSEERKPDFYIETPGDLTLGEVDFDGTQFRRKGLLSRLSGGYYELKNLFPDQHLVLGKCPQNSDADIQLVRHYDSMFEAFRNNQDEFECDYLEK